MASRSSLSTSATRVGSLPVALHARERVAHLEEMAREPLDVLVIGGGITGVGCALDAASRGLRVGIVERDDWSAGTSSRSSKMLHGGLRYLATGDVGVVRESLRERVALRRNATHLVRPLSMLLPVYGRGPMPWGRLKLGTGLWAYDALGHRRAAGSLHRWRNLAATTRLVPNIATRSDAGGGRLRGAEHYHDDAADDCRLVLSVLRSAVAFGARAVNGTPVVRMLRDGDRVCGVVVSGDAAAAAEGSRDGELEIEARVVINATGVWADGVADMAGADTESVAGFRVTPTKGIHLTVRREQAGIESGIAFFEQTGNANIFLEPWQDDLAFVGTSDTPYAGDLTNPQPTEEDIAGLLTTANQFLRVPIERGHVVAAWAGLRPLVQRTGAGAEDTKDVSRRHLLVDTPGLVTITGGKLTAYRSMAQAAVDAVAEQLGVETRSCTSELHLDGWDTIATADNIARIVERTGITRAQARHLQRRHGANTQHLVRMIEADRELAEQLHPERPYVAAEAVWARTHEQAVNAQQVIARRTRLELEVRDTSEATRSVETLLARGDSRSAELVSS